MSKTLAEMTAETVETNTRLGWYEKCATFDEAMALLHTEVGEASDAWRRWGLKDRTDLRSEQDELDDVLPKPEGVGSEFADVLIRLLDDSYLFGVDLEAQAGPGQFGLSDSFLTNMNTLHTLIAKASMAHGSDDWADEEGDRGGWTWKRQFGSILKFIRQLAEHYGFDLDAEYERKAAFNRTRPYRHGNKLK